MSVKLSKRGRTVVVRVKDGAMVPPGNMALGATRGRIVAQLFAEAFVLSGLSALAGLGIVAAGLHMFDRSLELDFAEASDRLLRATESLDLSRELIASARDYHQAKIGQDAA